MAACDAPAIVATLDLPAIPVEDWAKMERKVDRAFIGNRRRSRRVVNRLLVGSGLTIALAIAPFLAATSEAAVGRTRATVNVVVANVTSSSGPVCLTLRDLTVEMVVGLICDGDDLDLNPRRGRITLDLPRRSFAIDARAAGTTVVRVTPNRFVLKKVQTVHVELSRKPTRAAGIVP